MPLINLISRIILFISIIFQFNCDNKDKWTALPLKITKHESYNYSEMISGDLDSTSKAELEVVKKITSDNMKSGNKIKQQSSFLQTIKKIVSWFKNIFSFK